ncbi:MAG TPA: DUF697 domain-containing protein [Chthonomonadaceae bacterium]|nr:DUF697 domain-containing protein [Chthonomonadaceae bacterium]
MESTQQQADAQADKVIATMVKGMVGAAVIPAHVNWALVATAMGAGVIRIGNCYGIKLTKDEAWELIVQFFRAAGLTFCALNVGSKVLAALMSSTLIGHASAVALDATISASLAYAVGGCAKSYFKGVRDSRELGRMMRERFAAHKQQSRQTQA